MQLSFARLRSRWAYFSEKIRSAFWFLPTLITLLILSPALATIRLGNSAVPLLGPFSGSEPGTAEGGRLILSSIATATMTVVGVLFSLTIVVLQQVSSQYSPRVVENFIRSKASQVVLGSFIGTFAYSLLVLRLLRGTSDPGSRSSHDLSVTVACLLSLYCLGLLIFYLHHLAKSIKSNLILNSIATETIQSLQALYGDLDSAGKPATQRLRNFKVSQSMPASLKDGYVQSIRWEKMEELLEANKPWRGEVSVLPGDFVFRGQPLMSFSGEKALSESQINLLLSFFEIGASRTHTQDSRFGVRQIVDIALRALSPGINDPSTAVEAANELGRVLLYFTRHCRHSGEIKLDEGAELNLPQPTYDAFVGECFDQLLSSGQGFLSLVARIHEVLSVCASQATSKTQLLALEKRRSRARGIINHLEKRLETAA